MKKASQLMLRIQLWISYDFSNLRVNFWKRSLLNLVMYQLQKTLLLQKRL